jgi:NADH-quinone oxidoreductase subunit N
LYTSLQKIATDFRWILPEIILIVAVLSLLIIDLLNNKRNVRLLPWLTITFFVITLMGISEQYDALKGTGTLSLYSSFLQLGHYECYFKGLFSLAGIFTVLYTLFSSDFKAEEKGEFYYLVLAVVAGLNFLVMAGNLLMMFISLELVSIGSYILTIFNFNKRGTEASLKYILFGAFSTAIMLFGISLLYGINGNFVFPIEAAGVNTPEHLLLIAVAIFMMLAGLLFKLSAFPFHVWTPDIYHGAPAPLTAFFSVAPKAAAVALLFKVLAPLLALNNEVSQILTWLLAVIAVVTMTIGNFSALLQINMRRLLAYSSIGHAGFMMLAVVALKDLALTAILFYSTVYLFMNFTVFGLVDIYAKKSGSWNVNNFRGLGLKMPFLAVIFVITMISLTGLPPTAGFYAKLFVFSALWESYQASGNQLYIFLLLFGLFNTVIALFYYLRIPYYIYFKKDESGTVLTLEPMGVYILMVLISLPLLILFFNPNWALNIIHTIQL